MHLAVTSHIDMLIMEDKSKNLHEIKGWVCCNKWGFRYQCHASDMRLAVPGCFDPGRS